MLALAVVALTAYPGCGGTGAAKRVEEPRVLVEPPPSSTPSAPDTTVVPGQAPGGETPGPYEAEEPSEAIDNEPAAQPEPPPATSPDQVVSPYPSPPLQPEPPAATEPESPQPCPT